MDGIPTWQVSSIEQWVRKCIKIKKKLQIGLPKNLLHNGQLCCVHVFTGKVWSTNICNCYVKSYFTGHFSIFGYCGSSLFNRKCTLLSSYSKDQMIHNRGLVGLAKCSSGEVMKLYILQSTSCSQLSGIPDCFDVDIEYSPGLFEIKSLSSIRGIKDCQDECQKEPTCEHFVFW